MGIHEQCVKCGEDMYDGMDKGMTCHDCLTKRIAELEADIAELDKGAETPTRKDGEVIEGTRLTPHPPTAQEGRET